MHFSNNSFLICNLDVSFIYFVHLVLLMLPRVTDKGSEGEQKKTSFYLHIILQT